MSPFNSHSIEYTLNEIYIVTKQVQKNEIVFLLGVMKQVDEAITKEEEKKKKESLKKELKTVNDKIRYLIINIFK